jgi:2-polyprenyl-3-methyl-5-hydroxy-6-metoxy-1,4-benzoquinol methylase
MRPSTSARTEGDPLRASFHAATLHAPTCPVCDARSFEPAVRRDRHGLGMTTAVCGRCGLVAVSPRPEDAWFDEFYAVHFWPTYIGSRFADPDDLFLRDRCVERSDQILATIAADLPADVAGCLDVGSGQGGMLLALRRRFPGARVVGVEPSESGVAFIRSRHGLDALCGRFDAAMRKRLGGPFDVVTLIHVLEHALDPLQLLRDVRAELGDGGRAYVEVPDLESPHWTGAAFLHIAHLHLFAQSTLEALLLRAGLEPVAFHRGSSEHWPWALGVVCRRADAPAGEEVPSRPRAEIRRIKRALRRKTSGPRRRPGFAALTRRLRGDG